METIFNVFYYIFKTRSYPTYEEWKLPKILESVTVWEVCSYPTYEEWKLPNNNIIPKAI